MNDKEHKDRQIDAVLPDDGPVGLSGWLLVLMLDLATRPIIGMIDLIGRKDPFLLFHHVESSSFWFLFIELSHVAILWILFPVGLIYLLANKNQSFVRVFIAFEISRILSALAVVYSKFQFFSDSGYSPGIAIGGDEISELIKSVLSAAIWLPYIIYSRRVRNTFISEKQLKANLTRTFA